MKPSFLRSVIREFSLVIRAPFHSVEIFWKGAVACNVYAVKAFVIWTGYHPETIQFLMYVNKPVYYLKTPTLFKPCMIIGFSWACTEPLAGSFYYKCHYVFYRLGQFEHSCILDASVSQNSLDIIAFGPRRDKVKNTNAFNVFLSTKRRNHKIPRYLQKTACAELIRIFRENISNFTNRVSLEEISKHIRVTSVIRTVSI